MIARPELGTWLADVSAPEWRWFAKRLSANDTGLTRSNQVGIYLPKSVAFPLLGIVEGPGQRRVDRDRHWQYRLLSHAQAGELRLVYYASKDECRLTRFGGKASAVQDPDNTSRILMLAFREDGRLDAWLARDDDDEDLIQSRLGQIVPGVPLHRRVVDGQLRLDELLPTTGRGCDVSMSDLPMTWALDFPPPSEISAEAVRRVGTDRDPDSRLMLRYECEFRLFRVVEEAHVLPAVREGFADVEGFLHVATSVLNRRKSRAGRALELHLATIFEEEGLAFESQVTTEPGSIVDFIFPSADAYLRANGEAADVWMLAVKTTLRDRWRQVLAEGRKLHTKHLLTLDEGVSPAQYDQITNDGIKLVVPRRNLSHFPARVRDEILTLDAFVNLIRGPATT